MKTRRDEKKISQNKTDGQPASTAPTAKKTTDLSK